VTAEWLTSNNRAAVPNSVLDTGYYKLNGTGYDPLFGTLPAGAETTKIRYGSLIQPFSPNAALGGVGFFAWQEDKIYRNAGGWAATHTCASMGVSETHTSLQFVWGRDGRPYVCGLYQDAGGLGGGACFVKLDLLLGTWSSGACTRLGPHSIVSPNYTTACAIRGRLYAGSNRGLHVYDPVTDECWAYDSGGNGGINARVVEHTGRIWYIAVSASNILSVYEFRGAFLLHVADMATMSMAPASGDFAVLPAPGEIAVFFNSSDGGGTGWRAFRITPGSSTPGGPVVVAEITSAVYGGGTLVESEAYPGPGLGHVNDWFAAAVEGVELSTASIGNALWVHKVGGLVAIYAYNGPGTIMTFVSRSTIGDPTPLSGTFGAAYLGQVHRPDTWDGSHLHKAFVPKPMIESELDNGDGTLTLGYRIYDAGPGPYKIAGFWRAESPNVTIFGLPTNRMTLTAASGGTLDIPNKWVTGVVSGDGGGGGSPAPLHTLTWNWLVDGAPTGTRPRVTIATIP